MKIALKSLSLLLSALLAMSVSYSCRKSSDAEPVAETSVDITPLTVTGRIGGNDTKVTYTIGGIVSQVWAVGDTIIGISSIDSTYTFVVSSVSDDGTATFRLVNDGINSRYGTATVDPYGGTVMNMIYVPGYAAKDFSSGSLVIDISNQDTTTVGTTSASGLHIPGIMTASGTVNNGHLVLTFVNQLELLMITNPTFSGCADGTSITSLTVSGSGTLPTTATFSASGFTIGKTSGTVTKSCSLTTDSYGKTTGTVLIALLPASSQNLIIKSSNSYTDTVKSHTPTASSLLKVSGATFDTLRSVLLNGKFTVSSTGKQVQFTKGNLYWDGSDFHIEENQTDYPTSWSTSHVGHFFWTNITDYQSGTASYMPYAESYSYSSQSDSDQFWCGEDNPLKVDGQSGLYALSSTEWTYLLNAGGSSGRTDANRFAKAMVNSVNGLIIFPDGYTTVPSDAGIATVNSKSVSYPTSTIAVDTWTSMESAGCVFLPAAGCRYDQTENKPRLVMAWDSVGSSGYCWSSTPVAFSPINAFGLRFYSGDVLPADVGYLRSDGYSVRLVK